MWRVAAAHQTALLVLDVQNYFFDPHSPAYLTASPSVLPRINDLMEHAVQSGWLVVATSHHEPNKSGNLMAEKWRHHPQGSECMLFPLLFTDPRIRHIAKEYYSAFFKTELEYMLRSEAIDRVAICGVMTHLCVDTTARHAFMLGFRPLVVGDACCSKTEDYHTSALSALAHGFADVLRTGDITGRRESACSTW